MKLLYTVILIILVLHLTLIKFSKAVSANNSSSNKQKLVKYYKKELNILARDTCDKFKNLSEQILKDKNVNRARTPLMQEFKRNISYFQEIYPIYKRYDLNENLYLLFTNMIGDFYYRESKYANDSVYIMKLMNKFHYDDIYREYESKYVKFITKKLLSKYEEFKNHLENKKTKYWKKFSKWISELKECNNNNACSYDNVYDFHKMILTPKERLYAYVIQQLYDQYIFYCVHATNLARGVLKDTKLKQLSPNQRQQLKNALKEYIKSFNNNSDIDKLYDFLTIFYENIYWKFNFDESIPLKERQLINQIFEEQGYSQFEQSYRTQFNDFVDHGFFQEFENFKASHSPAELKKEKPLLEWLEHFKLLTTFEERVEAFVVIYEFIE